MGEKLTLLDLLILLYGSTSVAKSDTSLTKNVFRQWYTVKSG